MMKQFRRISVDSKDNGKPENMRQMAQSYFLLVQVGMGVERSTLIMEMIYCGKSHLKGVLPCRYFKCDVLSEPQPGAPGYGAWDATFILQRIFPVNNNSLVTLNYNSTDWDFDVPEYLKLIEETGCFALLENPAGIAILVANAHRRASCPAVCNLICP